MKANIASKAYANIEVESGALAADPHKLISMLYQGALLAIAKAKNSMMRKDIRTKCAAISKAVSIVDEGLNASLDKKVGGDLAQNLSSLYEYMVIRLTMANANNDMAALDEVARLLNDLKGAWENIRPGNSAPADAVAPPAAKAPPVYAAPVAAVQSQVKAATPAPVAAAPSRAVAAAAPANAPAPLPPQQQRALNKVQSLYGRM